MKITVFLAPSVLAMITVALGGAPAAFGSTLHGCLVSTPSLTTTCPDNGTLTPTGTTSPVFTFEDSGSGTQTGDLLIVALIPNNEDPGPISSFTLDSTVGLSTTAHTAGLFSSTAWTMGGLATFLGLSASPNNPIGAWLPCVQTATSGNCGSSGGPFTADPGATGFFVYVADLGSTTIGGTGGPTGQPVLAYTTRLPLDSLVLGFQNISGDWDATANSGALYANTVPEPNAIPLVTVGILAGAFFFARRRRAARNEA